MQNSKVPWPPIVATGRGSRRQQAVCLTKRSTWAEVPPVHDSLGSSSSHHSMQRKWLSALVRGARTSQRSCMSSSSTTSARHCRSSRVESRLHDSSPQKVDWHTHDRELWTPRAKFVHPSIHPPFHHRTPPPSLSAFHRPCFSSLRHPCRRPTLTTPIRHTSLRGARPTKTPPPSTRPAQWRHLGPLPRGFNRVAGRLVFAPAGQAGSPLRAMLFGLAWRSSLHLCLLAPLVWVCTRLSDSTAVCLERAPVPFLPSLIFIFYTARP